MSLATLFTLPNSPEDFSRMLAEFTFSNNADHIEISAAILRQKQISIFALPLEPLVPSATEVWLLAHQATHVQQTAALNIAGQDFTVLNLQDREALFEWLYEHASEHRQMRQALGI